MLQCLHNEDTVGGQVGGHIIRPRALGQGVGPGEPPGNVPLAIFGLLLVTTLDNDRIVLNLKQEIISIAHSKLFNAYIKLP